MKKVYAVKEYCLGEQEYHLKLLNDIYKTKQYSKEKFNKLYYDFCENSRQDLNKKGLNLSGVIGFTSMDAVNKKTKKKSTIMFVIEFPIKPNGNVYTVKVDEKNKPYIMIH